MTMTNKNVNTKVPGNPQRHSTSTIGIGIMSVIVVFVFYTQLKALFLLFSPTQ